MSKCYAIMALKVDWRLEVVSIMENNKRIKIVDTILIGIIVIILLLAFSAPWLHQENNKTFLMLIGVLALIEIGLSTYRYWIAYPEFKGLKAPIFVPKAVGLGWSLNPRNPIGMALTIITVIILIVVFAFALM